jgi:hypothetical protein
MRAAPGPPAGAAPASRWPFAAPTLVATLAAALAIRPIDDFDVWYHLAAGRLMWRTGEWLTTNTFGFTAPDHPWIDLHWMFEAVLYAVYSLTGINGCILLAAAAAAATALLLYVHARRFVAAMTAAVLMAVALLVAAPRLGPRPEIVSFVLFALFLRVLDDYPHSGFRLYWLVPLEMLWANTDGIFAVGLGLIGCYWLGAVLVFLPLPRAMRAESRYHVRELAHLTAVGMLAGLACIVNPYGLTGARFPLEMLSRITASSVLSQRLGEFQGPFSGYAPGLAWAWAALVVVTGLVCVATLPRWHVGRMLAVLVFGYLSAQAHRYVVLFAWVAVPVVAAGIGDLVARWRPGSAEGRGSHRLAGWTVGLAFGVLLAAIVSNRFWPAIGVEREFGTGISRLQFSEEAIAFADQVGISGRPFNCLSMGGFLAWRRFPDERVFVDGRMEAYPELFFRNYFNVMEDPAAWPSVMAHYDFDYAFLYHGWPSRQAMINGLIARYGWVLAYYDDTTSLLLPGDERHRPVRERAAEAFAALQRRRAEERPTEVASWRWRMPVEAFERARIAGDFLTVVGRHAEARDRYARAVALRPDSSEARFALGSAFWRTGARAEAEATWRETLRRDPGYTSARDALADPAPTVAATAPPR